jgi:hypothetical protein
LYELNFDSLDFLMPCNKVRRELMVAGSRAGDMACSLPTRLPLRDSALTLRRGRDWGRSGRRSDTQVEHTVALKLLHPSVVQDQQRMRRFVQEE